jgi:hypothetical protein
MEIRLRLSYYTIYMQALQHFSYFPVLIQISSEAFILSLYSTVLHEQYLVHFSSGFTQESLRILLYVYIYFRKYDTIRYFRK